jgi:hypothetical protein
LAGKITRKKKQWIDTNLSVRSSPPAPSPIHTTPETQAASIVHSTAKTSNALPAPQILPAHTRRISWWERFKLVGAIRKAIEDVDTDTIKDLWRDYSDIFQSHQKQIGELHWDRLTYIRKFDLAHEALVKARQSSSPDEQEKCKKAWEDLVSEYHTYLEGKKLPFRKDIIH